MKSLIASVLAGVLMTSAMAQVPDPEPPSLNDVLKRPNAQVVIFQPVSLAQGQELEITHMRVGDGSVKPGMAVQLVIYAKDGDHEVLHSEFHRLFGDVNSDRVLNFSRYVSPDGNRKGIIAVLIGLLQPTPGGPTRPTSLPGRDLIGAQVLDGTAVGMLLPAVQKVREAAAR